jgi:hypothetical protein
MVKVTFVIKNKTALFFDELHAASIQQRFNILNELHRDKMNVTMQYGNSNDIATGVELNRLLKIDNQLFTYEFGERKGYKLATFYIG